MSHLDAGEELSRELRERSRDVGGHPLDLETVRDGARRIRRRRRAAGGAVVAAVLAIAVPTALTATGGLTTGSPQPVDQPVPTASASPTEPPGPRPDGPVPLTSEGLPTGAAPQVGYLMADSDELVTPEGTLQLPVTMQGITGYGDGWLGLAYADSGSDMVVLDADLQVTDRSPIGGSLQVSPDGGRVGYVQVGAGGGQRLVSAPADGDEPTTWELPERPAVTPHGFLGDGTVVYETAGPDSSVGLATPDGTTTELGHLVNVSGVNPVTGLVAGQTRVNDDASGCFGVVGADTAELVWETCDHSLGEFSPDGRFVLASDPYLDGIGLRNLSILDARTGHLVSDYQQERDSQVALTDLAWEDDETVVAVAQEIGRWSILRMDVRGVLEAAVGPTESDPMVDVTVWFAAM